MVCILVHWATGTLIRKVLWIDAEDEDGDDGWDDDDDGDGWDDATEGE